MKNYFREFKKILLVPIFGLLISPAFSANPPDVYVHLYNGGGYVAGLFYKENHETTYRMAGNWLPVGASTYSPTVRKGSSFCVSISVVANLAYVNYYYNTNGQAPDWFNGNTGNANLNFYGDLLFSGIQWGLNGTQSAGLLHVKTINTQSKPCMGF